MADKKAKSKFVTNNKDKIKVSPSYYKEDGIDPKNIKILYPEGSERPPKSDDIPCP